IAIVVLTGITRQAMKLQLEIRLLPPVCLLFFAVFSIVLVTFGRVEQFGDAALTVSRYGQLAGIGICGLLAMLASSASGAPAFRHALLGVIAGLIFLGYGQSLARSEPIGRSWLEGRKVNAYTLRTYKMQTEEGLWDLGCPPSQV